nr:hypothetical protein CFP56_42884 [Quercus suber]
MAIKLRYNILKKVELEASNLYDAYIQENEACDINLINCKNLKKLELYTECMTDEWFHYHISQLAHIEKLIIHCNMLEKIKISSQSLKALFLLKCDKLVEVKIDTPKLCLLSYCGHSKISLSLNASVYLSEACYQMVRPVDHWDVQKIELLSKLSNSKVLYLTGFYVAKDVVVPKELRDTLPSPSYNVKQLKVAIYQPWNGHEIDRLVDNLLWISPLPEIVVITCWINVKPWKDTTSFKMVKPVNHWDVQKIELLSKLSNSKLLNLPSFYFAKDVVIPKELRDTLPSPPYNVKQLKVAISQPCIGREIDKLVDNLLWISPLPEIVLINFLKPAISFKDVVIPKELRDTLPSPPYNVKQLKVAISQPCIGREIDKVVDNLLWISPLPEIVLINFLKPAISFKELSNELGSRWTVVGEVVALPGIPVGIRWPHSRAALECNKVG